MFFRRPVFYFLLLLLVLMLFAPNGLMSYWDEDEAAYAGFAMNMLETGDWLNPDYDWSRIHRKTPGHFWGIAVSFWFLGYNAFALRLSSALSLLLTIWLLYSMGSELWGRRRAQAAALIFGSSLVYPFLSKMALTDGPLLFTQVWGALALWLYMEKGQRRSLYAFYAAIGLGVLIKGPPIVLFLGGMWLTLLVFHPNRGRVLSLHPWFYGLLALLPFGLWAWLSWRSDGGALLLFLYDWYIAKRVGGSVLGQTGPPGYHAVVILIAFIPWLPYLLPALGNFLVEERRDKAERASWFIPLAAWFVWAWLFYEFMSSKLPSYALAAHPAFAILAARYIDTHFPEGKEPLDLPHKRLYITGIVLFGLLWFALNFGVAGAGYYLLPRGYSLVFLCFALLLPYIGFLVLRGLYRDNDNAPFWMATGALSFWIFASFVLLPILEDSPIKALKPLAIEAVQRAGGKLGGKPIIIDGTTEKQAKISLLVYIQQYGQGYELRGDIASSYQRYSSPDSASAVFILGTEGRNYFVQQAGFDSTKLYKVDWWSTDDQLRSHPFYILEKK